jgi:hypothetical protein
MGIWTAVVVIVVWVTVLTLVGALEVVVDGAVDTVVSVTVLGGGTVLTDVVVTVDVEVDTEVLVLSGLMTPHATRLSALADSPELPVSVPSWSTIEEPSESLS